MKTLQPDQALDGANTVGELVPKPARLRGYLRYLQFFIYLASLFEGAAGER